MELKFVLATVVGAVAGYAWYRLVGCPAGTCPLTRNPWVTTLYGAALGALLAGSSR